MENIDIKNTLDSEEYLENEKAMHISEQWEQNTYDSENEIMKFSDEEEQEKNCTLSDIDEVFNVPNEKAWGKKKKSYYSTDYIDADYVSVSQKDIAYAEFEEQEAIDLQKKLSEYLSESDFGLDLIISKDYKFDKNYEHIKSNWSKLNKRQQQEMLIKENPEFKSLVVDFKSRLIEAKILLGPFLDLVGKFNCAKCYTINFVKLKYDLLLHYCTNISIYLVLKSKKEVVSTHPVIKRLSQYRQLLSKLEQHQENIMDKIKEILELNKNEQFLYKSINYIQLDSNNKKCYKYKKIKNIRNDYCNLLLSTVSNVAQENDELTPVIAKNVCREINKHTDCIVKSEKRAITYEIAKNKGLLPHRKKEQRNPRVKHRNKYRKAKMRRKGAIREVKKETIRYDGEISGIKTSVKKSIKLK